MELSFTNADQWYEVYESAFLNQRNRPGGAVQDMELQGTKMLKGSHSTEAKHWQRQKSDIVTSGQIW